MSWEVPEGRHYLAGRPRWWYWERWGSRAGDTGQTKQKLTQMLKQGNYMSQYETGYGAATATATADHRGHRTAVAATPVAAVVRGRGRGRGPVTRLVLAHVVPLFQHL